MDIYNCTCERVVIQVMNEPKILLQEKEQNKKKVFSTPVNKADICAHQIVVHVVKIMQWYTTAVQGNANRILLVSSNSVNKI